MPDGKSVCFESGRERQGRAVSGRFISARYTP